MSPPWALLAGLLLALGPNGGWIDQQMAEADALYHRAVPVEWLGETPRTLWIVYHRRDEWLMAVYLPPDAEEIRWARAFPERAKTEFERLLPELDVPRLFLRESVYRRADGPGKVGGPRREGGPRRDGLVDPSALAVDSSEIYFNALLDAHLDRLARPGGSETGSSAGSRDEDLLAELLLRAGEVMESVPEEHRPEAFRAAVIDFASHLLSVASEVSRQARRHPPEKLCAVMDHPATIFGAWNRALGDGQFPGRWQRPRDAGSGEGGRWITTREVLRPGDKSWVVEALLGAAWTGEAAKDFSWICSPATG